MQQISISPSARLAIALCVAHVAAAGVLWLLPIPALGLATFTLPVAISLVYFLARDAALRGQQAIVALELRDDGISFRTRGGNWVDCELQGSSYVSPRLTIVNLRPHGRRRTRRVILVPGNVNAHDFRRLRVWLRWKRAEGSALEPAAGK